MVTDELDVEVQTMLQMNVEDATPVRARHKLSSPSTLIWLERLSIWVPIPSHTDVQRACRGGLLVPRSPATTSIRR